MLKRQDSRRSQSAAACGERFALEQFLERANRSHRAVRVAVSTATGLAYVHFHVFPALAMVAWVAACLVMEIVLRSWERRLEQRLERRGEAALGGWRLKLALLASATVSIYAAPSLLTPHAGVAGHMLGAFYASGALLVVTSQHDLSRWMFLASAPVPALGLILNMASAVTGWDAAIMGVLALAYLFNARHLQSTNVTVAGKLVAAHAEAQQAARRLQAALQRAEEASEAKTAFLATMSHEIRTPLNGVLGMVQALARTPLAAGQREMVQTIDQSGLSLLTILDAVLDISKLEASQVELEATPFDVEQLLGRAVALFAGPAASKGLALRAELEGVSRCRLVGDHTRIRQIVVNFLSNAVKFTSVGEVVLSAQFEPAGPMARLQIAVRDTGPGIPHEVQAKLFHKFVQGDSSTTRRYGGSGLGLAITRELAALMGGEVAVESAEGAGATFRLTLELPLAAGLAEPEAQPPAAAAGLLGESLRLLAAEDNETNQLVLKTLLEPLGIELRIAGDGAEALAQWRTGGFDLVLMDLHMPVMDGLQVVRAMRAHEAAHGWARTPVVALTANAMSDQVQRCLDAGMDAHVAKPIRLETLLQAIEAALEAQTSEQPPRLSIAG